MTAVKKRRIDLFYLIALLSMTACTRSTIEFGTVPENNYTRVVFIDTVQVRLSTVLTDSFTTGSATSFLLGRYHDPYLGKVNAKSFFQLDKPAIIPTIPAGAVYDSLSFIVKPNDYYYGDTSLQQTIAVHELAQTIITSYNDQLYNTSNVENKPDPLGTKTLRIRPAVDDSVEIRLSDTKGRELFAKLQQLSTDISTTDNFLSYFKGISLSTAATDLTAVFGLQGAAGSNIMRLYYHTNTPYEEKKTVDFPSLANTLAFNQVLAERAGTGLVAGSTGTTEIAASRSGGYSFSQPGTGLYLKMIFPSLKSIQLTDNYTRLLKAELIVRPAYLSFDRYAYKLPARLYLAATDGSNLVKNSLTDSSGSTVMYASPVIDDIYGENNYYRFNITSYIGELLATAGTADYGLYLMQDLAADAMQVNRLVAGESGKPNFITELQLSVLVINK